MTTTDLRIAQRVSKRRHQHEDNAHLLATQLTKQGHPTTPTTILQALTTLNLTLTDA